MYSGSFQHNSPEQEQFDSSGSGVGSVQDKFHGWDVQIRSVRRLLFERILTGEFIIYGEYCRV